MLRIDRTNQSLSTLAKPSLSELAISERYDLQEFIVNSPKEFFGEIGEELFILGKEIVPSPTVGDRIDVLGVDPDGSLVIVELKRGSNKLQMLQAISYAGMIADWTSDDVLSLLDPARQAALDDFLSCDAEQINSSQRVLLIAETYDLALLSAAEWLCGGYGVPIRCCRISMATDATSGAEYLTCATVYPPPELTQEAAPRGRPRVARVRGSRKWATWEEAIEAIESDPVRDFLQACLRDGWDNRLSKRVVSVNIGGKRRLKAECRSTYARGVQLGRFEGDLDFWRSGLSDPESVKSFFRNDRVLMSLQTEEDFRFFAEKGRQKLAQVEWETAPAKWVQVQSAVQDEDDDEQ